MAGRADQRYPIKAGKERNREPSHPEIPQRITAEGHSQISGKALVAICSELKRLLADVFAMYIKTNNCHWHMTGSHFRDYHLLLNEQAGQRFAMTNPISERSRKMGGDALRSVGDIAPHQTVRDNGQEGLTPEATLSELLADNRMLSDNLRTAHVICDQLATLPRQA